MSVTDLAVVGLGFWGAQIAAAARGAGLGVTTYDDGNPLGASRNAAGIVQRSWYRQETIRKMMGTITIEDVDFGIDALTRDGLSRTGEVFTSYQNPEPRVREDLYLLPEILLPQPDVKAHISEVRQVAAGWEILGTTCRNVVLSAGWWVDEVLRALGLSPIGVRPLLGRALVAEVAGYTEAVPRTHLPRPYKHLTVRPLSGAYRIGDTTEALARLGDETPFAYLEAQLSAITGGTVAVQRRLCGVRPVCDQFTVTQVAPGLIVATGGHRVGLALGPAIARRAVELLR